jgi:hypothetical protein
LNEEQRTSLTSFVEWCDANAAMKLNYATKDNRLELLRSAVVEALELSR